MNLDTVADVPKEGLDLNETHIKVMQLTLPSAAYTFRSHMVSNDIIL